MARAEHAGSGQGRLDEAIARVAEAQHGVFTRAQASRLGASRSAMNHRLAAGRWDRCSRDVFRLAGVPPSWRQSLLAACLAWGDGAAASHRAAAALWRLPGFDRAPLELTVPRGRDRVAPGLVHRCALTGGERTVVDAIPVTVPARTLVDLAAVMSKDVVEEALDDALRRRLVTAGRMRWLLRGEQRGRRGVAVMRALLEARAPTEPDVGSLMETRLLRLLHHAGLPEPVRQHRVRSGTRTVAVVDFAYPDVKLAVEADGFRWHSGRVRWERDRARLNALMLLGWRVVHVTWTDLTEHPDRVAAAVRVALDRSR